MPLYKSHLINKLPWFGSVGIALGYIIAFIICVAVGAAGPSWSYGFPDAILPSNPLGVTNLVCASAAACTVQAAITVSNVNGYNQVRRAAARLDAARARPARQSKT